MGNMIYERLWANAEYRTQRVGTITDTDLQSEFINAAYLEVAGADIPFRELDDVHSLSLVDGTAEYALPSDWFFYLPSWGRITTSEKRARLKPMTRKEYLGKTDYDDEGIPTHYHAHGSNVVMYPVPDQTLTGEIDYRKRPATLTPGNATVLPGEWDEAVVLGIIYRIYDALQEHEKYLVARNNFVQYIRQQAPSVEQEALSPTPLQVAYEESDI